MGLLDLMISFRTLFQLKHTYYRVLEGRTPEERAELNQLKEHETIPKLIYHFRNMYKIMNTRTNRHLVAHGDNVRISEPFIPILYDIVPDIQKNNQLCDGTGDKKIHVMQPAFY